MTARAHQPLRSRKVHRLVQKLRAVLPWLEACDLPAARSWAVLELIRTTVFTELVKNGVMGERNQSRRLLKDYQRLKLAQLVFERALGIVPVSRMALEALGTNRATNQQVFWHQSWHQT